MSSPVSTTATAYLANIPSPPQGVWYVGPIPLRAYALCIIVGIVVAIIWGDRRWVARGGRKGTVTDVAVFAVPFGLVGGRLYHVATDWHKYFGPDRNPIDALKVWEGGLGIWGAVALGAVGAWIGCRYRGVPLTAFADAVAPGLILAQGIGRLGNWFNQELYGEPTTQPWGLEIYRRIDPGTGLADPINGVATDPTPVAVVHPTFLYELIWCVLVAGILVLVDRRFRLGRGRLFGLYVALYSFGRLWVEMMRTDEATHLFGVRINTFTSVIVFLIGAAYVLFVRGQREDPAALRGKPLPGDEDDTAAVAEPPAADSADERSSEPEAEAGDTESGTTSSETTSEADEKPKAEVKVDAESGDRD